MEKDNHYSSLETDNFDSPSFYVEDETHVFNVTDKDLSQFIKTIENIESRGYVGDQGMYKLKVSEASRAEGSGHQQVLNILKPHLKGKCVLQELRKYPLCDCLGYRAISGKNVFTSKFATEMALLSVYSSPETCCLQILQLSGSPKAVVDHWFDEARTFCVETRSARSELISHDEEGQGRLLENGKKLKVQYDQLLTSASSIAECRKKKEIHKYCSCEDCFVQSDPEDESDGLTCKSTVTPISNSALSKFPKYAMGIQLNPNKAEIKVTKSFSLSNLVSVLDLLPKVYRGLQIPHFYVGQVHSCFAAHTEDGALYAANYLHLGFPKIWVAVSAKYSDKVREALTSLKMDLNHTSCSNSLNHKYYILTLNFFDNLRVPYQITAQHEGEIVILKPDTLHFGFNTGPNVAEAVNFGTVNWIPVGVKSMKWRCRCFGDESIHLDMKPLVAAFFPQMLKSLCEYSVGKLQNEDDAKEKEEESSKSDSPQTVTARNMKTFECPVPECKSAYRDHRRRLVEHVRAQHPDSAIALLNQIETLYPTKVCASSTATMCEVCTSLIRGSSTHLEKHYKRQLNNAKLNLKTKEDYAQALERLQQSVKRRKKVVKANDNPEYYSS
ncbi:Lysine-specific demethylase 4E [Frankliniella fusca]|uniref:Lysine-specific demethylase 4E n=1 Tax=Frankliniella fusca TaxID=407009 RepID=A0AAE1HLD2_9NEOP|nr:Lysine-specific demethylase 4E [Frankliniella fusca]